MAKYMGNDGAVLVGTVQVAEVSKFTVNESAVISSDVACGDTWAEAAAGSKKWSGSVEFFYDFTAAGQVALTPGTAITLKLYPTGANRDEQAIIGSAEIENLTLADVTKDVFVSGNFSFIGAGSMTKVASVDYRLAVAAGTATLLGKDVTLTYGT